MPACKRAARAIKQVLLAGDVVVGVGNIYASEALFLAGIRPDPARRPHLSRPRALRLACGRSGTCWRGRWSKGGSTLRDFSNAHGEAGLFPA